MVGERILDSYQELNFAGTGLSLGVAKFIRTDGELDDNLSSLFQRADQALYQAKERNGNQIVFDTL